MIPAEALAQHVAILGKTGSGKTSTEKLAVEQVVNEGFRVCVLDSVKSDWWGITSSADGTRPGLPFRILGGPRGHVPLHSSAGKVIGQLVGSGQLPLSIIDMADFEPGGLQRFFVDFAPALMRSARGVLYLVVEEAHEFAPKERAGIGAENLGIHWAKKLATAGRSKGIRLIVATQRVQSLHNAVLGSCETVIVHRLTTPADQEPVTKWLKANTDKKTLEAVEASLSSLPTGTGWLCSGEARIFERIAFPKFATYDNTATPVADGEEVTVKTAPVDRDELRALIGEAVIESEANDPKALKAEIAKLRVALSDATDEKAKSYTPPKGPDVEAIRKAQRDAYRFGWLEGHKVGIGTARAALKYAYEAVSPAVADGFGEAQALIDAQAFAQESNAPNTPEPAKNIPENIHASPKASGTQDSPVQRKQLPTFTPSVKPSVKSNGSGGDDLSGPQRKLLGALAWWKAMGHDEVSRVQAATVCGWRVTSSNIRDRLSELSSRGLVEYPRSGMIRLTTAGEKLAPAPNLENSLVQNLRSVLSGPELKVFDALLKLKGRAIARDDLAAAVGWSTESSNIRDRCSSLSSLEIIHYPSRGQVALQNWVIAQ